MAAIGRGAGDRAAAEEDKETLLGLRVDASTGEAQAEEPRA